MPSLSSNELNKVNKNGLFPALADSFPTIITTVYVLLVIDLIQGNVVQIDIQITNFRAISTDTCSDQQLLSAPGFPADIHISENGDLDAYRCLIWYCYCNTHKVLAFQEMCDYLIILFDCE